jgi:hypothetical protein
MSFHRLLLVALFTCLAISTPAAAQTFPRVVALADRYDVVEGQQVTLQIFVGTFGGPPATGTAEFTANDIPIPGCVAVPIEINGALCPTTSLPFGPDVTIVTRYSGDANYRSLGAQTTVRVRHPTAISVTATPDQTTYPAMVTVTASANAGTGGGMIDFSTGYSNVLCRDVPLENNGTASCTAMLPGGPNDVRATFKGNGDYFNATSAPVRVHVHSRTTLTLSARNPSAAGVPIQVTATPLAESGTYAAGVVAIFLDGVPACRLGEAPSYLYACRIVPSAGQHVVTGRFEGADFDPSEVTLALTVRPTALGRMDFDGNRGEDILWRNAGGRTALWTMDGASQIGGRTLFDAGSGWTPVLSGDFNGDGFSDVLFEHTDGRVAMWLMQGTAQIGGAMLLPAGTGWRARFVADFDGDGEHDILWEHSDGRLAVWLMDGATQKGGGILFNGATGWHPKLVADFDGDGRADLVVEDDSHSVAIVPLNVTATPAGFIYLVEGRFGWRVTHAADLDGDGQLDLLWQHDDGRVAAWLMRGIRQIGGGILLPAGTGFVVSEARDIDADGRDDIVWRHPDGRVAYWTMQGAQQKGGGMIFPAGSGWSLLRVADFNHDGLGDIIAQHDDGRVAVGIYDGADGFPLTTILPAGTGYTPVITPR